jgi:hypothetical protein
MFGFCLTGIQAQSLKEFTDLKGYYLGQTPPGDTPVVFAPGIISADSTVEHGAPAFSPNGNEVFWQSNYRQRGKETQIFSMTMRRVGNKWMAPEKSQLGSGFVFSTSGDRLYFNSKEEEGSVCFIEKQGERWSEPRSIGLIERFPELKFAYNITFTNKSTFYFLGYAEGFKNNFAIYRTELINGEYVKPKLLPLNINTPGDSILNWTPYIAPDESYLIFARRRVLPQDDYGDLYICFRHNDGSWTNPVSLGELINSKGYERFPSVSPDGKYLFFTRFVGRDNEDVYWVSANIIEKLRKKNIKE